MLWGWKKPQVIKPDLVTFGGEEREYFHVLTDDTNPVIAPQMGTSFAAPYALRTAVGIKSSFRWRSNNIGDQSAYDSFMFSKDYSHAEVGWGKLPENINDIIVSPNGVARIVYQGELKPQIPEGSITNTRWRS